MTPSPIAAVRSLPRFAYLSPAEAREVVLAVLGAVRDNPPPRVLAAGWGVVHRFWGQGRPSHEGPGPGFKEAHRAMIDALVAEVQEEGR